MTTSPTCAPGGPRLLAAEDASAVTAIDRAIEAEEANARIYGDRIKALQEECRKQTYANREQQRSKAIEKIKGKLRRRQQIASDLQNAIERVGELYTALIERDEAEQHWPFPTSRRRLCPSNPATR
jgi:hypothetical protein